MKKSIAKLLEGIENLNRDNKRLRQQLREARDSIVAIETGNVDAVIGNGKKTLKVYTERTADKTYRILIEKMHEGAVTLTEKGSILYCNSYFAKMVNLPLQKVIGTKFSQFIHTSSKKHFENLLVHGKKNPARKEIDLYTNTNKVVPVLISINAFSLDAKFVLSIILTDLTIQNKNQEELKLRTRELEQKNTELEIANKDLTSFTHVSSHDLQEPLRKIQTFVSLISGEEETNLSDNGKNYFHRIRETAKRMQALIEDLLTYSRIKSGEHKFEMINLSLIVEAVKKDLEEAINEKKATIRASSLCEAAIIPFQFRQLIHNLLGNSLKFSSPGKSANIIIRSNIAKGSKLHSDKLLPKIDYCHLIYTDNGIGFDPRFKDRIFEVFQRLHTKEAYPGTGMGLAICKRVVENHHGIITATGKLNKGTRFDIYIPVNQKG